MSLDPYSLCPCGSGNKLKFCCQAITGEMSKVERLIRGNQNRLALQSLETLFEQYPGNPWIGINRAAILMRESQPGEAVDILRPVVEQHPDHLNAIALMANAAFAADGFELAKPFIHRAFQRCQVAYPAMVGNLSLGIAAWMSAQDKSMAARQHLTLAMRLVSEEHKQSVFVRLIEFDGNRALPFPLRSVHELAKIVADEEWKAEADKARRLSDMGCWRPAAKIFAKLAEEHPDRAELWQNAALCRAWDGDERHAAEAFHKAAELSADFETQVEFETLAQLLDYNATDDVVTYIGETFRVESISDLIPRLEQHPRIVRLELTETEVESKTVAAFLILDRDESTTPFDATVDLGEMIHILAQVNLFEGNPDVLDGFAVAFVTGQSGEPLDVASRCLSEVGGDLVSEIDTEIGKEAYRETLPKELSILAWNWHFPKGTPAAVRRQIELRMWKEATLTRWVAMPLACLGGISPLEAAGNAERRVALAAAVVVLDAYCDRAKYNLEIDTLRERLSLDAPQVIDITPETSLNTFTVMQLQRLPVEQLTDAQLSSTLNRAILVHHGRFLKRVLVETLKRPACAERVDINRVHMTLFDLCCEHDDRDGALHWAALAGEEAQSQDKAFEKSLQWAIRELSLRIEDPQDEKIVPLLERLDTYFLPKVPELRPALEEMLEVYGVACPWAGRSTPAGLATAGAAAPGGIWTPESAQEADAPQKKIWMPGQD